MNIIEVFVRLLRTIEPQPYSITARINNARGDRSTFETNQRFVATEFDQIPWDDPTKIIEAHWYPAGDPLLPQNQHDAGEYYVRAYISGESLCLETKGWLTAIGLFGSTVRSADETFVFLSEHEAIGLVKDVVAGIFADYNYDSDADGDVPD